MKIVRLLFSRKRGKSDWATCGQRAAVGSLENDCTMESLVCEEASDEALRFMPNVPGELTRKKRPPFLTASFPRHLPDTRFRTMFTRTPSSRCRCTAHNVRG